MNMSSNSGDNRGALDTTLREAIVFGSFGNSTSFNERLDHAANILMNSFSYSDCTQPENNDHEKKT